MINFDEELNYYEEALTVEDAANLSGDAVKDILDIVKAFAASNEAPAQTEENA